MRPVIPEWMEGRRTEHEKHFRECVREWGDTHILSDIEVGDIQEGFYCLKDCRIDKLHGDSYVYLRNSVVNSMYEKAYVLQADGDTCVNLVSGNSVVAMMQDQSFAKVVMGKAAVYSMSGRSRIERLDGMAFVATMAEQAKVLSYGGDASVYHILDDASVSRVYNKSKDVNMQSSVDQSIVDAAVYEAPAEYSEEELAILEKGRRILNRPE